MASGKSSFSTNEAVNFVLADGDSASDFDSSGSEVSNEEFTDDDNDDLNVRNQPLPEVAQRGSCRTTLDALEYEQEEEVTPEWKKINDTKLRKEKKNRRFLVKNRYRT